MPSFRRIGAGLLIFAAGVVGAYCWYISNHGELADAKIYSSLQKVEYENRHKYSQAVILVDLGNPFGKALGLKNYSRDNPYTWVLLNQTTSEQSVAMVPPAGRLDVACQDIDNVLRGLPVEKTVMIFLSQNCKR
jgi:hypothetical protein